ncbi:MAG: hypothetical protein GEU71_08465 [Actinobacteria bacterium]|nr:hypothetical protein [Actinomycetota bacterium]
MKLFKLAGPIPRAAAVLYATYRWMEDHTDEVERWSQKAIDHAEGKRYEVAVLPPARALKVTALWMRNNRRSAART